jgi:hypothetical protein
MCIGDERRGAPAVPALFRLQRRRGRGCNLGGIAFDVGRMRAERFDDREISVGGWAVVDCHRQLADRIRQFGEQIAKSGE